MKCGSMMFPNSGKYVCKNCGYEKEIEKPEVFKSNTPTGEEIAVVGKEVVALPKTRIICPECNNTEAYYNTRQTRSADEPSTTFYRCCKCNHSWREY